MNDAVVLDASAVLALLVGEPGQDAVAAVLPGALLSAVNLAEVVSKLAERGMLLSRAGAFASRGGADHSCPVGGHGERHRCRGPEHQAPA